MESFGISMALFAVALLCGWGAHAAWTRGRRLWAGAALALVLGGAGCFFYLASIATGSFMAGLGEMLIAIALLVGPAAGIVLGIVTAQSRRVGLALAVLHGIGLTLLMSGVA